MTLSLVVLCVAACAIVAFSTSALLGGGLATFSTRLDNLTPAAQARLLLGIAVLPALACAAVMTAALAPTFGWILDHCTTSLDPHTHPHICADHQGSTLPAVTLVALGASLLGRVATAGVRVMRGAVSALLTRRGLEQLSLDGDEHQVRVLPFEAPQAFIVGVLWPTLFVTRGLLSARHQDHLAPALAHERAHLRRRDPLRRLLAMLALGFHLPGIASWLERRLACAHEMAADAAAAHEVRSPERVARALVRLTRARSEAHEAALAFAGSDLQARVTTLLDRRPRRDQPGPLVLLGAVAVLFGVIGARADAVHHGVEIVLGFLGG